VLSGTVKLLVVALLAAFAGSACTAPLDPAKDSALITAASGRPASEAKLAGRCIFGAISRSSGKPDFKPGVMVLTADHLYLTPLRDEQVAPNQRVSIPLKELRNAGRNGGVYLSRWFRASQLQVYTGTRSYVIETEPIPMSEKAYAVLTEAGVPTFPGKNHYRPEYTPVGAPPIWVIPN